MAHSGITKVGKGRYRVDFGKLQKRGLSRLLPLGIQQATEVDPYSVGQAIRAVMRDCKQRSTHGHPLVWNSFKIFFEETDFQSLRSLDQRLKAELDTVIRSTVEGLKAETVGDVIVHTLVPEEDGPPQGYGDVVADFVDTSKATAEPGGEPTVRVSRFQHTKTSDMETHRVPEPAVDGALQLDWGHGSSYVSPLQKVKVGRPHGNNTDNFVGLTGASNRINSYQLTIENGRDSVVIARPVEANPVQVGNRLVQPGGKIFVENLPVQISLSNGEMTLRLNRLST